MNDIPPEAEIAAPPGFKRIQLTPKGNFADINGPLWRRIDDGKLTIGFRVEARHCNPAGGCHGGMLMAFADTAFGHAVSMRKPDHYWVTVRLLTDFLSSAKLGDWVEGTGEVAGADDDLFTVQGRIWCGDRTIMTGTGIFKTLGPRPPRKK